MCVESTNQLQCLNCSSIFSGNYCNNCGQSSKTSVIDSKYMLFEFQHLVTNVDRGFFYTLKYLVLKPSDTIKEFIQGKRIRYYKPISLIVVLSLVHGILEGFQTRKPYLSDFINGFFVSFKGGTAVVQVGDWLVSNYSYTVLLLIPFFSLASWISFKKIKNNYFEHLVLNMYTFGLITLFFIISFPLSYVIKTNYLAYTNIIFSFLLTSKIYLSFFNSIKVRSRILNIIITYCLFILIAISLILVLFLILVVLLK